MGSANQIAFDIGLRLFRRRNPDRESHHSDQYKQTQLSHNSPPLSETTVVDCWPLPARGTKPRVQPHRPEQTRENYSKYKGAAQARPCGPATPGSPDPPCTQHPDLRSWSARPAKGPVRLAGALQSQLSPGFSFDAPVLRATGCGTARRKMPGGSPPAPENRPSTARRRR